MNARSKSAKLRTFTLVICTIELIALGCIDLALLSGRDSLGIGKAVALLISAPAMFLVVPAFLLAASGRALKLAFALAIIALPLSFALWYLA